MKSFFFAYTEYRKVILDLIEEHPDGSRGQRKALSQFLACSLSYLTNVLKGQNDLSLEQAEALCRYFSLGEDETKYFLLLVCANRAATLQLKTYYDKELSTLRRSQSELNKRLEMKNTLSPLDQSLYYSHWSYQAIHVLCGIPDFQEAHAISAHLHLPLRKTQEILDFLTSVGLLLKSGMKYKRGVDLVHLERDSAQIVRMHSTWRSKVSESLLASSPDDLHYSLAFSCSKQDFEKVKEELVVSLKKSAKHIQTSRDQVLGVLCLDLMQL